LDGAIAYIQSVLLAIGDTYSSDGLMESGSVHLTVSKIPEIRTSFIIPILEYSCGYHKYLDN